MRRATALVVVVVACRFNEGPVPSDAPCGDRDGDGVCDDDDGCPDDPAKAAPGVCGCMQPDSDSEGDGIADCIGCADGHREGFSSLAEFPDIAACAGGWRVPGVLGVAPACNHHAGDDGSNGNGIGCSAADLCQGSWRLCRSAGDVAASSPMGCTGAVDATATTPAFFATGQSGPGSLSCAPSGANDLFGCGSLGVTPDVSCAPLTRGSQNLCSGLGAPWSCGVDANNEASNVTKPGPEAGGVLCCRTP